MANYYYSLGSILMSEMFKIVAKDPRSPVSAHLALVFVDLQNEDNA